MARPCRSSGAEVARGATVTRTALSALVVAATLSPRPASAMHLAEGTLPAAWSAVWWAATGIGLALALARLRRDGDQDPIARPLTGTMAALIFVLSSLPVPVPVAGSSGHACGTGLAAVLIGPLPTFLAAFVSLLLQALIEGHGGITTLGANAVSMGLGALAAWALFRLLRHARVGLPSAAAAAAVAADLATYGATTLQLALAHRGDHALGTATAAIGVAFLPVQLPIAILESAFAAGAMRLLRSRRPDLLARLGVTETA